MKHIAAAVDLSAISSHVVVGPASRAQCIEVFLYILHKPRPTRTVCNLVKNVSVHWSKCG